MRWLILVLLIVNALLFGYFKLEASTPPSSMAGHEPIDPEKLKLLTPEALAALPPTTNEAVSPAAPSAESGVVPPAEGNTTPETSTSSAPPAPPVVSTACYEWGSFARTRLGLARAALKKLKVDATLREQASEEASRYWIYLPKLATPEAAQAKADELKQLGINDLFVVQEPQWRNAISFGVFKDEALANKLLTELQFKGVTAVKAIRNQEKGQVSLVTKAITAEIVSELESLKPNFPGSEVKQVVCP